MKKFRFVACGALLGLLLVFPIVHLFTKAAGAFPEGGLIPRSGGCFAICKYKGCEGRVFLGMSAGDCDSACDAALQKCKDSHDEPCTKLSCSETNCGMP